MKTGLIITTALTAVSAVAFIGDDTGTTELLVPGVGIENYVTLGVSTKNEVKIKYGNDFTVKSNYSTAAGVKTLVSDEMNYKKQGITFFFHPESDTVFALHVQSPFKAKTSKNIVLGESTLQDVENAYGKKDIFASDNLMFEEYPGIRFYVLGGKGVTEEQLLTRKVVKIAIINMN